MTEGVPSVTVEPSVNVPREPTAEMIAAADDICQSPADVWHHMIAAAPSAPPAPPNTRCSECDNGVQDDWTYCPYCGAQGRSDKGET